jgi:hypothetical protein
MLADLCAGQFRPIFPFGTLDAWRIGNGPIWSGSISEFRLGFVSSPFSGQTAEVDGFRQAPSDKDHTKNKYHELISISS